MHTHHEIHTYCAANIAPLQSDPTTHSTIQLPRVNPANIELAMRQSELRYAGCRTKLYGPEVTNRCSGLIHRSKVKSGPRARGSQRGPTLDPRGGDYIYLPAEARRHVGFLPRRGYEASAGALGAYERAYSSHRRVEHPIPVRRLLTVVEGDYHTRPGTTRCAL